MKFVYLIMFALLLAIGQLFFKKAAIVWNADAGIGGFLNPWLVGALTLYGVATFLWVWILKTTPLLFAYPFSALGFVLVPLASMYLFGESISLTYVLGACLIVTGIVIIGAYS